MIFAHSLYGEARTGPLAHSLKRIHTVLMDGVRFSNEGLDGRRQFRDSR